MQNRLITTLRAADRQMQNAHIMAGASIRASLALLLLQRTGVNLTVQQKCYLSLIVHHGGTAREIRRARCLLRANSLLRANQRLLDKQMADRILVIRYKKQKYSTQVDLQGKFFPSIKPLSDRSYR